MKKLTKEQELQEEAIERDAFREMFDLNEDDTDYYENKYTGEES